MENDTLKKEKICFSWKLNRENETDKEYIEILENYKKYGYTTMTKLVAAALKEYSKNHSHKVKNETEEVYSLL